MIKLYQLHALLTLVAVKHFLLPCYLLLGFVLGATVLPPFPDLAATARPRLLARSAPLADTVYVCHDAHEYEDLPYMAAWLKGVRLDQDQHLLEMEDLLRCRALHHYQRQAAWGVAYPGLGATDRLRTLGFCYQLVLENLGRVPAERGFSALGDN